jgi:hypothetical protein
VHVLDQMVEAVKPGRLVLDLQVIRPNPIVEADGGFVCEIDGEPLVDKADAATAAIDALIHTGMLPAMRVLPRRCVVRERCRLRRLRVR